MSVLDTNHTPKVYFLLVPKQETYSKPDKKKKKRTTILKLNDLIVMHMLPKGKIKMDQLTNLALLYKFQRIHKVV